ncbi:MAG: PqqD family protein [bacterium]
MVLRPEASIVEQEVDDGLLLLRETGDYIVINRTGTSIWKLTKSSETAEELIEGVVRLPGAPPRTECERQSRIFLERLKDGGFLVEVG